MLFSVLLFGTLQKVSAKYYGLREKVQDVNKAYMRHRLYELRFSILIEVKALYCIAKDCKVNL